MLSQRRIETGIAKAVRHFWNTRGADVELALVRQWECLSRPARA